MAIRLGQQGLNSMQLPQLPPGQQLVADGKWPTVGETRPREDDSPWRVTIGGEVHQELSLSLDDLRNLPQRDQAIDLHCVTRWSKLGVHFSGVPLLTLLDGAGPTSTAKFVSFVARSPRNHSTSLPIDVALELQTIVALAVDGKPLSELHGGPVRVVVPGRYFYKSLKWLERIELLSDDHLGFWEATAGYHNAADPWQQQRYLASEISKATAKQIVARGDISGQDLRSLSAQDRDLRGLRAVAARLRNADFRNACLQGACFDDANLTNAHMQGADLRNASFRNADLEGANLSGADLRGACLLGARLLATSFFESESPRGDAMSTMFDRDTQIDRSELDDLMPTQRAFVDNALDQASG